MIHFDETQVRQSAILDQVDSSLQLSRELELINKLNPKFSKDGNQYCYLYGENLQVGIAGFGDTVAMAVSSFYKAFYQDKA